MRAGSATTASTAPTRARRGSLLAVALLLLLGAAAPTRFEPPTAGAARRSPATTILDSRLRDAPGRTGKTVLRVAAETGLFVTGRAEQGFYPVSLGGVRGWLPTGSLAVVVDAAGKDAPADPPAAGPASADRGGGRPRHGRTALRTRTKVNLRQEPGADAPVLETLPRGTRVKQRQEQRDGWVRVSAAGRDGWLLGTYLTAGTGGRRAQKATGGQPAYRRGEVVQFIYAAADQYGQSREDMLRVARCESDLVPTATNKQGGSYGIFQFKTQTWLSTPYADDDIFDPRANALAAAWMWAQGKKGAWVCQ